MKPNLENALVELNIKNKKRMFQKGKSSLGSVSVVKYLYKAIIISLSGYSWCNSWCYLTPCVHVAGRQYRLLCHKDDSCLVIYIICQGRCYLWLLLFCPKLKVIYPSVCTDCKQLVPLTVCSCCAFISSVA